MYKLTGPSNTPKVLEIKCEKMDERVHKILTFLSANDIHIDEINIEHSVGSCEGLLSVDTCIILQFLMINK
jgi:hypothetical protein